MVKRQVSGKGLDQKAVKVMTSLARGIAKDSVKTRCFLIAHQPEEPKDLAKRLQGIMRK